MIDNAQQFCSQRGGPYPIFIQGSFGNEWRVKNQNVMCCTNERTHSEQIKTNEIIISAELGVSGLTGTIRLGLICSYD